MPLRQIRGDNLFKCLELILILLPYILAVRLIPSHIVVVSTQDRTSSPLLKRLIDRTQTAH